MSKVLAQSTKSKKDDELTLAQIFAEMQHLREQMDRDQEAIIKLKYETDDLKAETHALLRSLRSMVQPC
jgi:hypothetical protein